MTEPIDEQENEIPEFQKEVSVPIPFPFFSVRKIAKQTINDHEKTGYQKGISLKAGVAISLATGIFIKHLTSKVLQESPDFKIKRKLISNVLLKIPAYRFVVVRLSSNEVFECYEDENEISKKIGSKILESSIKPPYAFVAPNPPGKHANDELKAMQNEKENFDAVFNVVLLAHRGYNQAIPASFLPSKNV